MAANSNQDFEQWSGWRTCATCNGAPATGDAAECPRCKGLGKITAEQYREWTRKGDLTSLPQAGLGAAVNRIVRLEEYRSGALTADDAASTADYRCPLCQDRGFVMPRAGGLDAEVLTEKVAAVPCRCRTAQIEERKQRHWRRCGFDARFLACRIETHPIALEGANPALIAELLNPTDGRTTLGVVPGWRRSWMLWGPVGNGKTGLAAGYAWRYLFETDGASVCVRTVPELLAELRATYNPKPQPDRQSDGASPQTTEAELLHRYTTAGLLVLDDLGTEQLNVRDDGSSWALDRLFLIVNKRHGEQLPMMVTSNLSPVQLEQRMGNVMGERLLSRIAESCAGRDHIREVRHRNLRYG